MPPKPNGFFFYMRVKKGEVPAWRNKAFPELSGLCSKGWDSLTKKEKQEYEDMKHDWNGFVKSKKKKKIAATGVMTDRALDCLGRPILYISNEEQEMKEMAKMERDEIKRMVERERDPPSPEFYLVHTTNYCITQVDPKVYCPAEISIGRFSIKEGFINEDFHAFIKEETPLGYRLTVVQNMAKKLKIPLDFDEDESKNKVREALLKFVSDIRRKFQDKEFVLFAHPADRETTINNLISIFGGQEIPFKVYSLADLVAMLTPSKDVKPEAIAIRLDPSSRGYEFDLGCQWHKENSEDADCSTTRLMKWAMSSREFVESLSITGAKAEEPKVSQTVGKEKKKSGDQNARLLSEMKELQI